MQPEHDEEVGGEGAVWSKWNCSGGSVHESDARQHINSTCIRGQVRFLTINWEHIEII